MVKKSTAANNNQTSEDNGALAFPVPYSEEELHKKVANLFLHQIRVLNWLAGEDTEWRIAGKTLADLSPRIYDSLLSADEVGLKYVDIQHSNFAQCMETMYQFAYYGILDESRVDPMDYETLYTWNTAVLRDMVSSSVASEWGGYGGAIAETAQECLAIAELADARLVLEGREGFIEFRGTEDLYLTVRQMALLAGMEEMTIRSSANPKRVNPLQTYTEANNTRVKIDIAKGWLQAKGRYIPIKKKWGRGDIDLSKRRFSSIHDLLSVVSSRQLFLAVQDPTKKDIEAKLFDLVSQNQAGDNREWLSRDQLSNPKLVNDLASMLNFPVELFALRVREVLAKEEIIAVEQALRELTTISK